MPLTKPDLIRVSLIAGGFAVVAAVVVASEEFSGLGIDGDEFAVAPDAGIVFVGYGETVDIVAHGFELSGYVYGELLFEVEAIGQVLVVKTGGVGGLLDVEMIVDDADEVVSNCGDNGGAAGGAEDEAKFAGFLAAAVGDNDSWGHGRERALAGGDGVGRALDESVHIGDALLGGEVVHLVVQQKAETFDGDSGAETVVEGVSAGYSVAFCIDYRKVRGLSGFMNGLGPGRWRHESGGADEIGGGGRFVALDGFAPRGGVGAAGHLLDGLGGEVGVAEIVGAVHEGTAESFGDVVHLGGGAVGAQLRQLVAGEDVEDLDEDDAAGGGRRRGDDIVTAIAADDRGALFDLVVGEVGGGNEASVGLLEGGDLSGYVAFVEVGGVVGDFGEGGGEERLPEGVACLIEVAVALEDAGGDGEADEVLAVEGAGLRGGEGVAFGGEADGGSHVLGEGELAEVLLGVDETGDGAGDSAGLVADGGEAGDDIFIGVEVHVGGSGGGGLFAVVEEMGLALVVADEHEASATEIAGEGIDDSEGEAYGHGRVDGVAALLEDGYAGVGGVVVDGDDHGVGGAGGFVGLSSGGEWREGERGCEQEGSDADQRRGPVGRVG